MVSIRKYQEYVAIINVTIGIHNYCLQVLYTEYTVERAKKFFVELVDDMNIDKQSAELKDIEVK